MSNPIYVRREKADEPGQYEYVEATPDMIDPEALRPLVVSHPTYREVLAESIERKEKIRALTAKPAEDKGQSGSSSVVPPPVVPVIDEEALVEKLLAKQQAIADARARAQADREAQIDALVTEFKLAPSAKALLTQATDPRTMAQTLASGRYSYGDAPVGGNPRSSGGPTEAEELQERIFKKLGI